MAKPLVEAKPVTATASRFAVISVFSGILFILILCILHILEPEFDPTWRLISEYALGNVGWLMHLSFAMLAVAQISVAVTIFPQIRTITGYLGLVILGISAIGVIIAAIFVTDPVTVNPDNATFSGKMHSIGAMLDYTPVAAFLISISLSQVDTWRPMRRLLMISSVISIVAMLLFVLQIPQDGLFGPDIRAGLYGRFLIVVDVAWLLFVGIHAAKMRSFQRK